MEEEKKGEPRPRRRMKKVALLIGSTLLSLALALFAIEATLRLTRTYSPAPSCYVVDFEIGKRLKPGFQGDSYGVPVSINRFGMRDREVSHARPKGTKRVIALGDSWTFGVCVKAEDTWPKRLEAHLGGSGKVEVLNTGVSGYETYNEAVYYRRDLGAFEHDLVLVGCYPVNDVHDKRSRYERHRWLHDTHPWLYELYVFPKKHLLVSHYYSQWRRARKVARRQAYHAAGAGGAASSHGFAPGDEDWTEQYDEAAPGFRLMRESIASIGATARERGAKAALVLFPDVQDLRRYVSYAHPKVAPLISKATKDAGLAFVDLIEDFQPFAGREPEISSLAGSTHVNERGYEVIARALAREIAARELLR
jgi:lysophospholipase L1-like esterase